MKIDSKNAVAHALRYMRQENGYTRRQVAQALGTTETTVYRWESGRATPGPDELYTLAAAYGCQVSDLFPKLPAPRPDEALEDRVRRVAARVNRRMSGKKGG